MADWSNYYGILYNCPAGKPMEDCPFNSIEKLSFTDKIDWFEKLPELEKEKIINEHKKCSNKR